MSSISWLVQPGGLLLRPENATGPTLGDTEPLAQAHVGPASPRRAQKFLVDASFRIELSSAWFAKSCSSQTFFFPSSFRRFAWSSQSPPHSFRQR